MKKIKVMSVFGTRPEATKMAPLVKELEKNPNIDSIVCVTAQHREMLDQVLNLFNIKPDYDLNIMKNMQTLTDICVNALKGLEEVIIKEKPDLILVHGDTSTTFAGSLAAFYHKVKLGHVEAGLRTYDKFQPYPEEMNRQVTSRLADLHFAPTSLSKENLLKENISADSIFVTGNTAIDCLKSTITKNYVFDEAALNHIDYKNKKVIAMTAHRRENIGEPLENICKAILELVNDFPMVEVVYAVHSNPLIKETAHKILGGHPQVHLIDPINMNDMHNLINNAYLIITDSGGLQEEAPAVNKPVVVLRNVTERPEGLKAGTLKCVGTEFSNIYNTVKQLLTDENEYSRMANAKNPYGDGNASERIVDAILFHYGVNHIRPSEYIS